MFAPIQNVVSTRDLFNSNPCRDFWDSQQFSQTASGSQGSQSSSLELLSQSKSSQNQKHESSYDSWYNTGNSQKGINEEEPVKYYMKYLSKPPLFSEQNKNSQEKGQSESYKEFIEAQKTKAIERDQRELLDNFIGLLKDYTKEVQNAMQSFKTSLETTETTANKNAENIKSAAKKSFTIVDELKEDFKSSFKKLRTDLKENDQLKSVLFKKEQELNRLDMELQLQKNQIDDLRRKEQDAHKKEDEFKQKEKRLLERIKEAEMRALAIRDTPPPSQESMTRHYASYHANSNPNMNQIPCLPDGNYASLNDFPRLPGVTQGFPLEHINAYPQGYHNGNNRLVNGNVDYPPAREGGRLHHFEARPMQSSNCPTASITPVQKSNTVLQFEKQNTSSPSILLPLNELHNSSNIPSIMSNTETAILSPANRVSLVDKSKFPRKSPVATVLPQVQAKPPNNDKGTGRVLTKNTTKKKSPQPPQDPSRIFSFDLSSSPQLMQAIDNKSKYEQAVSVKKERSQCQVKTPKPKLGKRKGRPRKGASQPTKKYSTRSRSRLGNEVEGEEVEKTTTKPVKTAVPVSLKRKVFNGVANKDTRKNSCDSSSDGEVSGRPSTAGKRSNNDDGLANISKSLEGCQKPSFKRQKAEKRTLDLSGSSLFEIIDEEVSIQQIAESIRKHAQKRKMK